MKLENVVPWGRNLQEYKEMCLYGDADRAKKILGCGDGPASVNGELRKLGVDIVSIDPIYQFSKSQIAKRVEETSDVISEQLRKNQDDFVWKNIPNVDALINLRLSAMREFLDDYDLGKEEGRYQYQELPELSFEVKRSIWCGVAIFYFCIVNILILSFIKKLFWRCSGLLKRFGFFRYWI